jgi:hypothetical protein
MSTKRYTDTEIWSKAWYRKLTPTQKCFWAWLCANCDPAGVVELDLDLASFQIGGKVTHEDLSLFGNRVKEIGENKIWLTTFIEFQFVRLSRSCLPHKKIFELLKKHKLPVPHEEHKSSPPAAPTGNGLVAFDKFWDSYPKKSNRHDAEHAFHEVRAEEHLPKILSALSWQKACPDWTKENGRFIPNPATYLRNGKWHDQPSNSDPTVSRPQQTMAERQAEIDAEIEECQRQMRIHDALNAARKNPPPPQP